MCREYDLCLQNNVRRPGGQWNPKKTQYLVSRNNEEVLEALGLRQSRANWRVEDKETRRRLMSDVRFFLQLSGNKPLSHIIIVLVEPDELCRSVLVSK